MSEIDKTIDAICDWIQKDLKDGSSAKIQVPEMTKALAELVSVRAKL